MNKSTVLALAAGLMGGIVSHYLTDTSALAQNPAAPAFIKEVRAQNFALVNENNQLVGAFSVEKPSDMLSRPRIVLRDAKGAIIWSAGDSVLLRPLTAK